MRLMALAAALLALAGCATSSPDWTPGQQAEVTAWRNAVAAKIRSRIYFPRDPNRAPPLMPGVAQVSFSVAGDGTIYTPQVTRSAKDPLFDAAALTIVLASAPLPPPPAFLLEDRRAVTLAVPVAFSLPGLPPPTR